MSKRYDICSPREGSNGKTYWTRIGTAFEGDKGIQLIFDALPLPDKDGRCSANLFVPREKQSGMAPGRSGGTSQPAYADDLDPPF